MAVTSRCISHDVGSAAGGGLGWASNGRDAHSPPHALTDGRTVRRTADGRTDGQRTDGQTDGRTGGQTEPDCGRVASVVEKIGWDVG